MFKFDSIDVNAHNKYPGPDMTPGTKLHDDLLGAIMDLAAKSKAKISKRYGSWDEMNELLGSYIRPEQSEIDNSSKSPNSPFSIVVPEMQANLELLLTAMHSIMGQNKPILLRGIGPEDTLGSMLLELIINDDLCKNKGTTRFDHYRNDVLRYGFAAAAVGYISEDQDSYSGKLSSVGSRDSGNVFSVLDPYAVLPDVNVGLHDIDKGSFFGYVDNSIDAFWLYNKYESGEGFFNIGYALKGIGGEDISRVGSKFDNKGLTDLFGSRGVEREAGSIGTSVLYAYVNIVPNQWGLGKDSKASKWLFMITNGGIIIYARQLDYDHESLPVIVSAPDSDGHAAIPVARIASIVPLQRWINFLMNSRLRNIRRSLNGIFVVNPKIINLLDFNNPNDTDEGLILTLMSTAWGDPDAINKGIKQLEVADVTQSNAVEAASISQMMKQVTGGTDALAGMGRHAERVTAAEVGTLFNKATDRIGRLCKLLYEQLHMPMSSQMSHNTMQYMKKDRYLRVYGEVAKELRKYQHSGGADIDSLIGGFAEDKERVVKVNNEAIQVAMDIVPHDLAYPRVTDQQLLSMALETASRIPAVSAKVDVGKLFLYMLRMAGLSNISEFEIEVQPDAVVQNQVAQGNLVKMGQ